MNGIHAGVATASYAPTGRMAPVGGPSGPSPVALEAPHHVEAVRFRRDGARLLVAHAPPVTWFAEHVLVVGRKRPDVGLSFDGDCVRLDAANGSWTWKLTGRSWLHSAGPGAEPLVLLEGVWPD